MKEKAIMKLIIIVLAYKSLGQESESLFRLNLERQPGSNLINLFCQERIGATFTEIQDASFFVDSSVIHSSDSNPFTHSGTKLTFSITRDREGLYSCANESTGPLSSAVPLVAFPDGGLIPLQPTYYAMQGESIQLHCSIQPGRLSQYYSARWDRSGEPIHTSSGDRYSINPTNLSLVIKKLHLNDTSDDYHCIVTVTDPNSRHMQTYDYHDTLARNNISLVVLGNFSRVNVKITNASDVIFAIVLGIRYNREVKLSLLYTNVANSQQQKEVLTSVTYTNATVINHLEFASQVPFNKFKVQIRLRFSDDTYGPYNIIPGEYDKNQTTTKQGCGNCKQTQILVGVFSPLLVLLIIAAVILIICCSRKIVKKGVEGNTNVLEKLDSVKSDLLAAIRSAGGNPPALNNGTKQDNIEDDYGTGIELGDLKMQKECGALISFVSDSLSAALENPKICDEVKKNIDSIIKKALAG